MSEEKVRAICAEFEVEIIPANEAPKPGQTRALSTLVSIFQKYGDGHLRLVLSTLLETKGNQGLMTSPILWATSDLVEACSEWIEKDLSDWYQAWDKIPLGWIIWHCQSLYGIVKVRQAAAGAMYVLLTAYSRNQANRNVDFNFLKRTGDKGDAKLFKQVPAATAIEAGKTLLEVKAALSPREFRTWLSENVGMKRHAAERYMSKARAVAPDDELPNHRKRTGAEMAEIGMECLMMKATLPRGEFVPWLETMCSVNKATANVYMRIADLYGDREDILEKVQATGLLVLAKDKTPSTVREQVERMVADGYFVTLSKIEALLTRPHAPRNAPLMELAA